MRVPATYPVLCTFALEPKPWVIKFADAEPPKIVVPPQADTKPPIAVMPLQVQISHRYIFRTSERRENMVPKRVSSPQCLLIPSSSIIQSLILTPLHLQTSTRQQQQQCSLCNPTK